MARSIIWVLKGTICRIAYQLALEGIWINFNSATAEHDLYARALQTDCQGGERRWSVWIELSYDWNRNSSQVPSLRRESTSKTLFWDTGATQQNTVLSRGRLRNCFPKGFLGKIGYFSNTILYSRQRWKDWISCSNTWSRKAWASTFILQRSITSLIKGSCTASGTLIFPMLWLPFQFNTHRRWFGGHLR